MAVTVKTAAMVASTLVPVEPTDQAETGVTGAMGVTVEAVVLAGAETEER
jgi:hypothetical protein